MANAYPEVCCELYEAFGRGEMEEARALHGRIFRLNQGVSGKFGVAGVKGAMEVAGLYGGPPRKPLLPLKETDKQAIRDAIKAAGLM